MRRRKGSISTDFFLYSGRRSDDEPTQIFLTSSLVEQASEGFAGFRGTAFAKHAFISTEIFEAYDLLIGPAKSARGPFCRFLKPFWRFRPSGLRMTRLLTPRAARKEKRPGGVLPAWGPGGRGEEDAPCQ